MLRRSVLALALLSGCDDKPPAEAEPVSDARVAEVDGAAPPVEADMTAPDATPDLAVDAEPSPPVLPALIGPAMAVDDDPDPHVVEVDLRAGALRHRLSSQLEVDGMAYNGQGPGPTLQARVGDEIVVHFTNDLDEPTTIHWHGLRISDQMDGSPRIQTPVEPGETFTYRFVAPEAGTFWYHPHVRAHAQVELGLYGALVVHEAEPPVFSAERVLVLDDILVEGNEVAPFLRTHMEVMHGRSGNVLLTNGTAEPTPGQAAEGDVERWRLINTANARTMSLSIEGASMRIIGTDGGLLNEPYESARIQLAVGQRYDVEVRYDRPGTVRLLSHVLVVDGNAVVERPFAVQSVEVRATGRRPEAVALPEGQRPARGRTDQTVVFSFDSVPDPVTGMRWEINGQDGGDDSGHDHPEPLFRFTQGEYVRMVLDNKAAPEHPFHLHGQFFEVLPDGRPETEQPGLKDTVLVPGESRVTIFARLDNPGRWMAHCHILEHAALGMMAEFVVEPR